MMSYFQTSVIGNTLQEWAIALGIVVLSYVALRITARVLLGRLAQFATRTDTDWDDIISAALERTRGWILLIFSLLFGAMSLTVPEQVRSLLESAAAIALFLQIGFWLGAGISAWMASYERRMAQEDAAAVMSVGIVAIVLKLALWSVVLLLSLDNMGVDVTALVAGLGIGGVAVALAAQNILGDLFASLSIVLDKPFVLGDFLIVGDHLGSVERIGLKTTRVRSLSGEQLIFSNGDLLSSRIRNYGRMYERRVVFKLGVTYQTPREKLRLIPEIIREAVEELGEETVRFDRSHFQSYGDFALTFETVYYVLGPDYNLYMDCQQTINFTVHRRFQEEGIEFAYPTQTLFLAREGNESSVETAGS